MAFIKNDFPLFVFIDSNATTLRILSAGQPLNEKLFFISEMCFYPFFGRILAQTIQNA